MKKLPTCYFLLLFLLPASALADGFDPICVLECADEGQMCVQTNILEHGICVEACLSGQTFDESEEGQAKSQNAIDECKAGCAGTDTQDTCFDDLAGCVADCAIEKRDPLRDLPPNIPF